MKKLLIITLFFISTFSTTTGFGQDIWQKVYAAKSSLPNAPLKYIVYKADEPALKSLLFSLAAGQNNSAVMDLPLADGTFRSFRVWYSPVMPEKLAAKYPDIRTFTAEAIDNSNITAKIDYTVYGFHTMIFDGLDVSMIDPADNISGGYYTAHYKSDETRDADKLMKCLADNDSTIHHIISSKSGARKAGRTSNGYLLRTYRLALACNHQYADSATRSNHPTVAQTFSKMTTTLNRVNGIYERELSIKMDFVSNEDTLIWTSESGGVNGDDPFSSINGDAGLCISTNQAVCDSRIGNANYDIGHVFTTGAGGLSQVGVVCQSGWKAQSVTGQSYPLGDAFDVDYVAHEMGHEYGANHPFNNNRDGSCCCGDTNFNGPTAYEPGSGSTIMAYAGICKPDNLQPHSDPYFHAVNLLEIQNYITSASGNSCGVKTPTNNKLVGIPSFGASYNIPCFTPFELTAPNAIDSVGDTSVTYCWEQWNLGDPGARLRDTHTYGPIFRSYLPATSPTRVFPRLDSVLAGALRFDSANNAEGEKVPDVPRTLNFRLTMRDIYQGNGCFLLPDDEIILHANNTGTGFAVTSQNSPNLIYLGKTVHDITWNVAGTNGGAIGTENVDIYMSDDGGHTWPYFIGTFPNNGSAPATFPNPHSDTALARIKVKGNGNVFFNVNSTNFLVIKNVDSTDANDIKIFPVPVRKTLYLLAGAPQQVEIFNAMGQLVWEGSLYGERGIATDLWARGIYVVRMISDKNVRTVRKIVVE
jgi:hypothetical protein